MTQRSVFLARVATSVLAGLCAGPFATLAYAQLVVRGGTNCPSAEMIRAELLAARPDRALPEQPVTVDVADDRLTLSLGEAPGARREIPADRDCSVRAASVALVIAAWSGGLPSGPGEAPVLAATSSPVALAMTTPPAQKARHVFELDGSPFYSPVWGHEPGIWLAVGRFQRDSGAGIRVLGAYQGARDLALEGGTNTIQRFLLGGAVTYQRQRTHTFASGDLGLVAALTHAQGTGYETNRGDSSANFGAVADLRAGLRYGDWRLWVNARGFRFAHGDTVKIQSSSPGVADSATLSAWDAQLGVGVGVRFE